MTVARRSPLALLRLATVLALAATQAAFAVEPLHQHDVVLLQKGELIE